MTKEQVEQVEQTGSYIVKMFHTYSSLDSRDYIEFINEVEDINDVRFIDDIITKEHIDSYEGNIHEMLLDFRLRGFVIELATPIQSNHKFDDKGEVQSWESSTGYCNTNKLFAENIDQLVSKIEMVANMHEERYQKESKDKLTEIV